MAKYLSLTIGHANNQGRQAVPVLPEQHAQSPFNQSRQKTQCSSRIIGKESTPYPPEED